MKLHIKKSTDKNLGALRISQEVFDKLEALAKKKEVSKQEVVRAILDEVIDEIEF